MRFDISALVAACLLTAAAPAYAVDSENPLLQRGVKLIQRMEETAGLRVLMRALRWSDNTDRDRALIHLYRGIAYGNMLHERGARRSFRAAIRYDISVRVPRSVSPKIRAMFDAVLAAERRRKRARARPAVTARRDADADSDGDADSAAGSAIYWPGWIAGGVAAGALAAAIGLGVASRSDQSAADDANLPYSQAQARIDAAASKALGANVLFGVAAAAAATSVVLFVIHHRGKRERVAQRQRQRNAAIVPLPGGGVAAVGGFSW